jgi:subtilisin family serine protease
VTRCGRGLVRLVFVTLAVAVLAPVPSLATPEGRLPGLRPPRASKSAPPRTPQALRFAPGEVIVIANEGVLAAAPDGVPIALETRLAGTLASLGMQRVRRVDPTPPAGATSRASAGPRPHAVATPRTAAPRRDRIWVLTSARPGFDPVEASRALMATGAVRAASPNYRIGLFATLPDDPYLFYQWYVDDLGFADIRLPLAWDLARGDTTVAIAIIDTGVDTGHPDLASRIWHNPGETAGNGLDDDGNGLIDDVEGWDFGVGDNDPKPEYTPDGSGIDVGFHGTFCAGIAAAATNNGDGIAGAGWDCRIMALKVADPDSGLASDAIAGAVAYAVDQGASVISMSFGAPGDPGVPEFFQALVDMATAAGAVCVAAAGNDGASTPTYPAACDHVLAVGATDASNARASFSNWGPWVDVAAPGSGMWSTICRNYTFSELDQLFYIFLFGWDGVSPYMYGDGTSFACPLTAGVCGLVRARFPYLTPQLVMQHVVATGDAVAYDLPVGVKVNAFRAVSAVPTAVATEERTPPRAFVAAAPNPASGSTAIRFVLPAEGWASLAIFDVAGRRVRTLVEGTLAAGPNLVRWDGRDDSGAPVTAAVYFARLASRGVVRNTKIVLLER